MRRDELRGGLAGLLAEQRVVVDVGPAGLARKAPPDRRLAAAHEPDEEDAVIRSPCSHAAAGGVQGGPDASDDRVVLRRPTRSGRAGRGGDEGTRTPDPRDANAVLFQLSYIPTGRRPRGAEPVAECSTRPRAAGRSTVGSARRDARSARRRRMTRPVGCADALRTPRRSRCRPRLGHARRHHRAREPGHRQPPGHRRHAVRRGALAVRCAGARDRARRCRPTRARSRSRALLGLIGAGAYCAYFTGLQVGPIAVVSGVVAAFGGLTVVLSVVFRGESLTTAPGGRRHGRDRRRRPDRRSPSRRLRGTRFAEPGRRLRGRSPSSSSPSMTMVTRHRASRPRGWLPGLRSSEVRQRGPVLDGRGVVVLDASRGPRRAAGRRARLVERGIVGAIVARRPARRRSGSSVRRSGSRCAPTWMVGLASSFGPAVTIVVAVAFLGERLEPIQWLGLGGSLGLIAIGRCLALPRS